MAVDRAGGRAQTSEILLIEGAQSLFNGGPDSNHAFFDTRSEKRDPKSAADR